MRFSQRLKQLRKELNLRQDDLARACGVKLTAISKYENEIIKPAFDMLSKMGLAYNVNLNWLVNEIGSMFVETPIRRLVKTGSGDFVTEQTEDKADFKKNYYSYKDGTPMPIRTYKQTGEKYQMSNFLNAKNKFFERHNKDYLPTKKEEEPKAKKAERIANW